MDLSQVPNCIPREAWALFLQATPETQREMLKEARRASLIQIGERPWLQSESKGRHGETVCFCQEMGMCPLRAVNHTSDGFIPAAAEYCSQTYPSDNGWWLLRDIVEDLHHVEGIYRTYTYVEPPNND